MQLRQEVNQILQAATQPIDRPGHDHIELAVSGIPAERIKGWALVTALGARNAVVLVDFDDLATLRSKKAAI